MANPLPPLDENIVIPKGVLKSSALADEIHKQVYAKTATDGGEQQPPEPEATPPQPSPTTPPATPPAAATSPVAPVQPQNNVPVETVDDWKHRYTSLKGRFDQQASDVANMRSRMSSMESMLATLNRPEPKTTQAQPTSKLITDEEVKTYGEDFLDVVARKAREAVTPLIEASANVVRTEVSRDLVNVKSQVGEVERATVQNAREKMLGYLDNQIENWRVVNRHPKFITWLGLTEPLSGATRRSLLDDAYNRNDTLRVASFFRSFISEQGSPPPNGGQPDPTQSNGGGKVPLVSLAAPGKAANSGAPPPSAPETKERISRAQISAFYARKTRGEYRGREKEAADLEAEIIKANNEGRIVN